MPHQDELHYRQLHIRVLALLTDTQFHIIYHLPHKLKFIQIHHLPKTSIPLIIFHSLHKICHLWIVFQPWKLFMELLFLQSPGYLGLFKQIYFPKMI